MLRGEGAVITRVVDRLYAVATMAEGAVIEQASVRSSTEDNRAVGVEHGALTVTGCDLRGSVRVHEGTELLLEDSVVHDCSTNAVLVMGTATIQGCIIQDGQRGGIQVQRTGEATLTGTTVRRCSVGVGVQGRATLGEGCRITANVDIGIIAGDGGGGRRLRGQQHQQRDRSAEASFRSRGARLSASPRSASSATARRDRGNTSPAFKT